MKTQLINNSYQQNKPNFEAKLRLNSITNNFGFNLEQQKMIVDTFEHNTKDIPGKLFVEHIYYPGIMDRIGAGHYYSFTYDTKNYRDIMNTFAAKLAKTPEEFTSKLQLLLDVFRNRTSDGGIKQITKIEQKLTKDSLKDINQIFPVISADFTIHKM